MIKTFSTAYTVTVDQYGKVPNRKDDVQHYAADFVRYHRRRQRMTQAELARKAKITQLHLSRIEHGNWQSIKTMSRLWRVLGYQFTLRFGNVDIDL